LAPALGKIALDKEIPQNPSIVEARIVAIAAMSKILFFSIFSLPFVVYITK